MQSASKFGVGQGWFRQEGTDQQGLPEDRKSTRLNSSHGYISYAVFCLKKKNRQIESRPLAGRGLDSIDPARLQNCISIHRPKDELRRDLRVSRGVVNTSAGLEFLPSRL